MISPFNNRRNPFEMCAIMYLPSSTGTAVIGPTPFSVQPDTTSSLYVTWSAPESPSVHPFLLRYAVITTHTLTHHSISSGTLLPHQSPWVVEGLNANSEYEVKVISWSPHGRGEEELGKTAFTFGPGELQCVVRHIVKCMYSEMSVIRTRSLSVTLKIP